MFDVELLTAKSKIEATENWRGNSRLIPFIKFKPDWEVKMVAPFGGAMARFMVKYNEKIVSVYLDFFDNLGCFGEPYWEVYPVNGDTARHAMADVDGLLESISEGLETSDYDVC